MEKRAVVFLFLLLTTVSVSYAGEGKKKSYTLSSSMSGGVMGIKDTSYSPLAYRGPFAGILFRFSVSHTKTDIILDAAASYGCLGNKYHKDAISMHNGQMDLSVGSLTTLYENRLVSVKAGGSLGLLRNGQYNRLYKRYQYAFLFDAKTCFSATLKLTGKWEGMIEERLPVISYCSLFNRYSTGEPNPSLDFKWVPFCGNDFKAGVYRRFNNRNGLTLYIRHFCYSSKNAFAECLQLQSIQLGIMYCFTITNR